MKPRLSPSERFVVALFRARRLPELVKLPEVPGVRTPDFAHFDFGKRAFVAELKVLDWEPPSPVRGWTANADGWWERDDNGPQRVAAKIHKGFRQLEGQVEPKILIFLNDDTGLDALDLVEAYEGRLAYRNEVFGYVNNVSRKIGQGAIREEKMQIDLYIWLQRTEGLTQVRYLFPTDRGRVLLHSYFGSGTESWSESETAVGPTL